MNSLPIETIRNIQLYNLCLQGIKPEVIKSLIDSYQNEEIDIKQINNFFSNRKDRDEFLNAFISLDRHIFSFSCVLYFDSSLYKGMFKDKSLNEFYNVWFSDTIVNMLDSNSDNSIDVFKYYGYSANEVKQLSDICKLLNVDFSSNRYYPNYANKIYDFIENNPNSSNKSTREFLKNDLKEFDLKCFDASFHFLLSSGLLIMLNKGYAVSDCDVFECFNKSNEESLHWIADYCNGLTMNDLHLKYHLSEDTMRKYIKNTFLILPSFDWEAEALKNINKKKRNKTPYMRYVSMKKRMLSSK